MIRSRQRKCDADIPTVSLPQKLTDVQLSRQPQQHGKNDNPAFPLIQQVAAPPLGCWLLRPPSNTALSSKWAAPLCGSLSSWDCLSSFFFSSFQPPGTAKEGKRGGGVRIQTPRRQSTKRHHDIQPGPSGDQWFMLVLSPPCITHDPRASLGTQIFFPSSLHCVQRRAANSKAWKRWGAAGVPALSL